MLLASAMSTVPEAADRLEKFSSSKTIGLLKIVREMAQTSDVRCVVFVEERAVAAALAHILNAAGIPNVRAASVVGAAPSHTHVSDLLAAKVR